MRKENDDDEIRTEYASLNELREAFDTETKEDSGPEQEVTVEASIDRGVEINEPNPVIGKAVRSHEPGIAGIIHVDPVEEPEQNINEIKEILEQADPKVREEVAKELEKEESVPVLVDKTNKTVLEPLVSKGRALLKSLASGKSKKVSWINTPHEPKH